ncbi:MAG TPA: DNA polymerase/3'-5' exonuclease PolX, partial [Bacteroidetes bacterium]|nr:DNA polymerase/3'-5' exonuclease PolX [Bacteroidota bacterium]
MTFMQNMTNKEIADTFQHLARLMELHGENPFKIRSYINAYNTFRKYPQPVAEMSQEELAAIKGVGKAISQKTRELVETGQLSALEKYLEKTPPGIRQLLKIKGLGPKKIKALWEGPGIETPGELLYACNENRLIELKGFGQKTQEDIRKKLEYFLKSQGKYLFADIEAEAEKVLQYVQQMMPSAKASHAGALRRKCNVVEKIELVVGADNDLQPLFKGRLLNLKKHNAGVWSALTDEGFPVKIYHCLPGQFGSKLFLHTAAPAFLEAFLKKTKNTNFKGLSDERMVFKKAGLPFIEPEMRENNQALQLAAQNALPQLIVPSDVKGVVHAHTTYSDGINTLRQMAEYAKAQGFEYLG